MFENLLDTLGLLLVQPADLDRFSDFFGWRTHDALICWESSLQRLVGAISVLIVGVLGEDRQNENIERVAVAAPSQFPEVFFQTLGDLEDPCTHGDDELFLVGWGFGGLRILGSRPSLLDEALRVQQTDLEGTRYVVDRQLPGVIAFQDVLHISHALSGAR
ncbi:MAG: hypothetical protein QXX19_08085 [Candidatus Caldarchaeum sp.]